MIFQKIKERLHRKYLDGWIDGFDKTRSIFTHIPKSAGTSISHALYGEDTWHYTMRYYKDNVMFVFNDYFKFAFVRDPFDRLLSTYLYSFEQFKRHPATSVAFVTKYASFEDFILDWINEENIKNHYFFLPQIEYITDTNGNIIIDFLGRFETLEEDFHFIARKMGVPTTLGKMNATKHNHYSASYTPRMRSIVERVYAVDISTFGYEYKSY